MTAHHEHTPTLKLMRQAFAMRHWNLTNDQSEGLRLFDEEIARIEAAAEQRGAERGKIEGLREAATIIRDSKFANSVKPPSKKVQVKEADWLDALADRLEARDA